MKIFQTYYILGVMTLLGGSCSPQTHQASVQQKIRVKQYSSIGTCSTTCAVNTVCDPQSNTCQASCSVSSTTDCSGQICSPVVSLCENTCNTANDCVNLPGNGLPMCVQSGNSPGYCATQCGSDADCGNGFKCYRGLCKIPCTANSCDANQVCDETTGSCEIACTQNGTECKNVIGTACSPISATCVPTCTSAAGSCTDTNKTCYFPNSSSLGTCEVTCTGTGTCALPNTSSGMCSAVNSTNLCQIECSSAANNCPEKMACVGLVGGSEVCQFHPCTSVSDCPNSTDYICNKKTGQCELACDQTTCEASGSGKTCIDNQCVTFQQSCAQSSCQTGYTCSTRNTCVQIKCTDPTQCPGGYACTGSVCTISRCGDGNLANGEVCDEGAVSSNTRCSETGQSTCPNNWSCKNQICVPNNPGAGNGQNGHCSADCQTICAQYVNYSGSQAAWATSANQTATTTITAALKALGAKNEAAPTNCADNVLGVNYPGMSGAPTQAQTSQCPCGYGIWVSNGSAAPETYPLAIASPMEIYGGFVGTETSIYDRVAQYLNVPLGQDAPSQTILNGSGNQTITLSASSGSITFDGFQITGGTGSATQAGGITVAAGTTANLQNLLITNTGNSAGDGGAILNLGTMTLKESTISLNTALNGGGVANESTSGGSNTIERVTFYGNGAVGGASKCLGTANTVCLAYQTQTACVTTATSGCAWASGACSGAPTACTTYPTNATCSAANGCYWGISNPIGGGAVYNNKSNTLNVYASKFNANYSYGSGGGVYTTAPANIISSLFTANWASISGGGVYLGSDSPSHLNSLTFVDNSAYQQGGGGIFDVGSNSTLKNSLFRDNKGLYPANTPTSAEWIGNRASDWSGQINSISSRVKVSSGSATFNKTMTLNNVDMCPIMSYSYNNTSSGLSQKGVCDGLTVPDLLFPASGLVCGSISPVQSTAQPTSTSSITYNLNGTAGNTCNRRLEFEDCTPPLYQRCWPKISKTISGNNATPTFYAKDISGAPNSGAQEGAYQ